jgi:hypothetical protein
MYDFDLLPYMHSDSLALSRENLEISLSQVDIMSYYIGYDVRERAGKATHSPFHRDKHPSFVIYVNAGNRIYWIDNAKGISGTAYDFVAKMYNCSFYQALIRINDDFDLGLYYPKEQGVPSKTRTVSKETAPLKFRHRSNIGVKRRAWSNEDRSFWGQLGINSKILEEYQIFALSHVFLNGKLIASYRKGNPIYGYRFEKDGEESWKIYWPYEERSRKWLSSTDNSVLQGWTQLPRQGKLLIVTKSLKDVVTFRRLGYNAIAPQGETQIIKKAVATELDIRFDRIIVINDFDRAGVGSANKMRKLYGWECAFLQDFKSRNNGLKDISDIRRYKGETFAKTKIQNLCNIK